MKHLKSRLHTQRRHLEQRLKSLSPFAKAPPPPSGWIKAIRQSLGMTARQLGAHLGMSGAAATMLEQREQGRAITLRDLDRAAAVLNCRVAYALIPIDGLEATLQAKAEAAAAELTGKAQHAMKLEAQPVEQAEQRAQREALTEKLIETLDSRLWETKKCRKK
jgi:predicted DNA-binding mobile mystery protein A